MKLLVDNYDYNQTIQLALSLNQSYDKKVIFHCYWNGNLNEKHYYSILSCWYWNRNHKIILWLEANTTNCYNTLIEKYAEIKYFNLKKEKEQTVFLSKKQLYYNKSLSYYSDVVRYILLYNYGGCWFDLDCLILRSFDPLFYNYENNICVYEWEKQNYPNGAIYISLQPKSEQFKNIIEFIIKRGIGWGFQEANLTYDLPLNLLVLPCSWFDGSWISNPQNISCNDFFNNTQSIYNFDNFFKGSFCYHWHNRWNLPIDPNSPFKQLINIIESYIRI